jgi:serine/threonine-protein kinase
LGQYEVQEFIGQGAMGRVYRAYHADLERTGAVKVMQAIAPDTDSVARFRHEAQAIAKLRHPNIVDVYDFGTFEGMPYMVVEYVGGGSLAAKIGDGALDRATALRYLRGIAAGLDYAHAHGIVHRDVKPANVLLTDDDSPVLADFGLAKLLHGSSLKSMTGVTTGTPAYMAPEQVTGSRVGPPADRYSLATIAYEMLTGVIPFDGEGLMELLYAQVHREPVPPSGRDASLGPAVDAVIMRGLAKDPAARWESSAAFVDALAEALAPARAAGPVASTLVMTPPLAATMAMAAVAVAEPEALPAVPAVVTLAYPSPPPATAKKRSRKPLIPAVAAAVVVVALLATAIGWAATHRPVTLSLSATTVTAGDTLVVSADHLPANQAGRVELWSAQYTYPFRAGANGHVDVTVAVPLGIDPGDHQVKVCWNNACHAETTLHVLAAPEPSPSPTPVRQSPTPRPTPTATPASSPSTSPNPRTLSVLPVRIPVGTGTVVATGAHFAPGRLVRVTFVQQTTSTNDALGQIVVGTSGVFSIQFQLPITARAGAAYVVACDPVACAYATVDVVSAT